MSRRAVAMLIVVALIAMAGVLGNDIVYDAAALLHRDARFAVPVDWHGLVFDSYWYQGLWRPVTLLFLGTQVQVAGGIEPMLLHAISLTLYLATTLALVIVAIRLGASEFWALAAGVLFAVHPLHVEVVASVVGQAEMLCTLAILSAIALWHRASIRGPSNTILLGLLAIQLMAAGAKEQGYLLTVILLGQQVLLAPRVDRRTAARWLGLLLLVAVTMWLFRSNVTGSLAGEAPAPYFLGVSPLERTLAALGVLPRALMMIVFPVNLGLEYGPPAIALDGRFGWLQAGGVAIIAVSIWAAVKLRTRSPLAAFGIWFAAITWLPASSLIVPAGLLLADRVLFLPTVGLALSFAAIEWPLVFRARWAVISAVAVGALWLGTITMARMMVWRDADTFYTAMTQDNPRSYRAWYVRAIHDRNAGLDEVAEAHLRRALELWPKVPAIHEELGQLLRADGRCEEALRIFRAGLALDTSRFQLRAKLRECERITKAHLGAQGGR